MRRFGPLWRKDGVGWGKVCIRGTGIQTAVIYERWQAGEDEFDIAVDYASSFENYLDGPMYVAAAIAYELGRRHKRTREWREALEDEQ